MFISLDLMLLFGKTKSHVNLYLVITLVDTRCIWNLSKSLLLSCLRQLGYVLFALCFDLRIASLLIPNLVTILVCYPSFAQCLFLQSNWCHWKFHFGCQFSNGVMINILWCRDETESLLWARTQGCPVRHVLVSGLLVMIHYETTVDVIFSCDPFLVISPYLIRRSIY